MRGNTLKIFLAWEHFFFEPVSTKGFGFLRIAWASTTAGFLLLQWRDIVTDYSSAGLLPPSLEPLVVRPTWTFTILDAVTSPGAVFALYLMLLGALFLCAIGFKSRLTTLVNIVLLCSFHERNRLLLGGGDTVLRAVGFILAIAPSVSSLSLDRALNRRTPAVKHADDEMMPMWPVRLLRWQLIVIYGTSVWWKLLGRSWRNGTAIAIALHHPTFSRVSPSVADALLPLTPLLTYATLIFESAWLLLLVPHSLVPHRWH